MGKTQNQLDSLSKSVINYQKLQAKGGEERKQKRLYEAIRTQSLVAIYTSAIIARVITEEEMSGFILYLDERLPTIVLSYDCKKSGYMDYLLQMAAYRALNYIAKKIKMAKMDFALAQYVYVEQQEQSYIGWQSLIEDDQTMYTDAETINILRYLCKKRPSFQKKIFIYLLGVLPYLSSDVVSNICNSFNIDLEQTMCIFQRIYDKSNKPETVSRWQQFEQRRNKNWSYFLYTQGELEYVSELGATKEVQKLEEQFARYKVRNESANSKLEAIRRKTSYTLIAKELHIPRGTVSSTAYFIRNVLEAIGLEKTKQEELAKKNGLISIIRQSYQAEVVELPRFEPMLEFNLESSRKKALLD